VFVLDSADLAMTCPPIRPRAMLLMLLFACGGCDPKPPAEGSPTALAAASRQAEEPAASASASPPVTSVAVGDVFGGEKLDAAWASETASKLEKSIAAHLDADQRALLGGIECRSVSCAIEVNDQQPERTKQLWKVLRKRIAPDVGVVDETSGVAKIESTDVQPRRVHFLLQFPARKSP
jgi:hypothetical protein